MSNVLNPNAEIADSNPIWYWMALSLTVYAVILAINPFGSIGKVTDYGVELNYIILRPSVTGVLLSVFLCVHYYFADVLKSPNIH